MFEYFKLAFYGKAFTDSTVGKMIKLTAVVLFRIGCVILFVLGLFVFITGLFSGGVTGGFISILSSILLIAAGVLGLWVGSLLLYAFGEIVECFRGIAGRDRPSFEAHDTNANNGMGES